LVIIKKTDMDNIIEFDEDGEVNELQQLLSSIIDKSNIDNKKDGDFEIEDDELINIMENEDIGTIKDSIINNTNKVVTKDNLTSGLEEDVPMEEEVIDDLTEDLETVNENVEDEEEMEEEAVTDDLETVDEEVSDDLETVEEVVEEEVILNKIGNLIDPKEKENTAKFLGNLCSKKISREQIQLISNEIHTHQGFFDNQPWRYDVLRFKVCDEINFNHKIDDGFWDGGHDIKDFNQNIYNTNYEEHDTSLYKDIFNRGFKQNREIILVDSSNKRDKRLTEILTEAKKVTKPLKTTRDKVNRLIELIDHYIGNLNETLREQVSLGNANIFDLMNYNSHNNSRKGQTIIVKLGDIGKSIPLKNNPTKKKRFSGLSRHKCILFKFLCDKINIKASLFRNPTKFKYDETQFDGHYWNGVVLDNNNIYIYDPRYFSGALQNTKYINIDDYRIKSMEKIIKSQKKMKK
jgi:hypothetical protein